MEYAVQMLKDAGVNRILVALGREGKPIREHFGDGSRFGVEIIYSEEDEPLGTAGPLRLAKNLLSKEPFFLIYGDILAAIDLEAMAAFHREHQGLATMALTSVGDSKEYGTVELTGHTVIGFTERRHDGKEDKARLTNAGIYIFEPEILKYIVKDEKIMLEDLFPRLIKARELYGYPFSGQWFDITTPKEYERAIKEWGRG
jgi:mannose-1-phosphate guanylyltransferase